MLLLAVPCALVFAGGGDTVRVAINYDPSTLNILEMKVGNDLPVILAMHENLITSNPATGERVLGLAESVEVLSNPKDIKIKIRKTSRFHTGDPVTAHDVKWTYQQCVDPKNANMMAGPLDEIESIEVVDDYTLVFHFWEPYAAWRELMWVGICSQKYYDKVGLEVFRKHPVGSGIFKFVERKVGESVTLEVVQDYHGYKRLKDDFNIDKPNFKYLQFVTVSDDMTRLAMLQTGELDIVSDISPHQVKNLQTNKRVKVKSSDKVPSLIAFAAAPYADPLMKDPYLGMAMRHAINRQEIVDKIFLGEGYPLYRFCSRPELGYDPAVVFDFNPEKAKEYLKKSSYKPGYPLMLTYTSMVPNAALVAAALQQYLQNIGMTITLRQLEEGVAATYSRNKDPKMGPLRLYSWAGGRDPSIRLLLTLMSTSPYASYTDRPKQKELDALVLAQARELDVKKRLELLNKIHAILSEDAVGQILFGLNMIYATSDRIQYTWTPDEAFLFNVHTIQLVK